MGFSDELSEAGSDIASQLHDVSVTVANPSAGAIDPDTGVRAGTGDASTFNARRGEVRTERAGGEGGERTERRVFAALASAVAAGQAVGSSLTADGILAGATLADGSETWRIASTSIVGGVLEMVGTRRVD